MGNMAGGLRGSLLGKQTNILAKGRKPCKQLQPPREEPLPPEPPPPLTDIQVYHLTRTWRMIEEDIAKVGVITFINLFETHPDVQQVFTSFIGMEMEDLKQSKELRAHALRVMAFVQKAVGQLGEPEKLHQMIRDLGRKHHGYRAKTKYVDLVAPQFFQAIYPSLEKEWDDEVSGSWKHLFTIISYVMKTSMKKAAEEETEKAKQEPFETE